MQRQRVHSVQGAILRRPRLVLAGSLILALLAALLATRVQFRKSRSELAPPDDPDQLRWDALLEEYRGSEALIACVEAKPGGPAEAGALREFADQLAAALAVDSRVEHVFHRLDLAAFADGALHLAEPEQLLEAGRALARERELVAALASASGLADLNDAVASRLERGMEQGVAVPERGVGVLNGLVRALRHQREFLENPDQSLERWLGPPGSPVDLARIAAGQEDGYLATRDGRTLFLLLTPRSSGDGVREYRAWIDAMRKRVASLSATRPGFRVVFTGQPALVVEEMETVRRDTWFTSLIAVVGVSLLTFLVFRWRTHALLVLGALALGILWSFGAVYLEYGYLNLITSSFISTLIGIGVAYGIHPVSEYELEGAHLADPDVVVPQAFRRTAAAVTVAAVTTSAAFLSIQLMQFRGFGELGLVAGVGVLLCLAAAMVTLPAMLLLYARRRKRLESAAGARFRAAPAVDRYWVEQIAGRICRRPRWVVGAALLITGLAAWAGAGLRFDINILDLLPRDAESLQMQNRMVLDSDLSPLFTLVVADDLDHLAELERRAAKEPTIARFESAARFLPADVAASSAAVATLVEPIEALSLIDRPAPIDQAVLEAALVRLEAALADGADGAFAAGLAELAGPLEEARAEVEASRELVARAQPGQLQRWDAGQQRLWQAGQLLLAGLRRAVRAPAPEPATLPPEVRQRFFTASGAPLGFLHPAGFVFDAEFLEGYVAASRRVSAEATGFPIVFHKMSGRITTGFYRAVAVGGLLVALVLILDYRTLREPLLALTPLAMGVIWMMGGMRLCGISFNFANLVAVPLIIGVGIDNGVHVIHRVRLEGTRGMDVILRHTGRAILIASLTTMIGFGSLALASHRGLASLGFVLLVGVGSCLLTSTVVLPNLLVLLRLCPAGEPEAIAASAPRESVE